MHLHSSNIDSFLNSISQYNIKELLSLYSIKLTVMYTFLVVHWPGVWEVYLTRYLFWLNKLTCFAARTAGKELQHP